MRCLGYVPLKGGPGEDLEGDRETVSLSCLGNILVCPQEG